MLHTEKISSASAKQLKTYKYLAEANASHWADCLISSPSSWPVWDSLTAESSVCDFYVLLF